MNNTKEPAPANAHPLQLLRAKQTAERLNISVATLYRMVKTGVIRQFRIGPRGPCRFRLEDIERALIPKETPDRVADDLDDFISTSISKKG